MDKGQVPYRQTLSPFERGIEHQMDNVNRPDSPGSSVKENDDGAKSLCSSHPLVCYVLGALTHASPLR